jgi:hypothetical protein
MKWHRLPILLALTAFSLFGMQSEPPLNPGSIEGLVTDDVTGQPLSGVVVSAGGAIRQVTTGNDGKFVIPSLPAGRYPVVASKDGFVVPFTPARAEAVSVTVGPKEAVRGVHLRLIRTSVVSGRVTRASGEVAAGVSVSLMRRSFDALGIETLGGIGRSGETDDRGQYRILNVTPGQYYVIAEPEARLARVFFPGTTTMDRATQVTVLPGQERDSVNIVLPVQASSSLRFRLGGAALNAVDYSVNFLLRPIMGDVEQTQIFGPPLKPDANGVYEIPGLPQGTYDIALLWVSASTLTQPRNDKHHFKVTMGDRDLDIGEIVIAPRTRIQGRITVASGSPLSAQRVSLQSFEFWDPARAAAVAEDGSFTLEFVSEGQYIVSLRSLPSNLYIQAVRYANRDWHGSGLTIDGRDHGPMEIVIGGPAGSLRGVIRNGQNEPVASAGVTLIPPPDRRGNPSLYLTAFADQKGEFSLGAVPPGTYGILASESISAVAFKNPNVLKNYEERAVRVIVEPGKQSSVEVKIIPAR